MRLLFPCVLTSLLSIGLAACSSNGSQGHDVSIDAAVDLPADKGGQDAFDVPPAATAVAKFCHTLATRLGDGGLAPTQYKLQIGQQPGGATLVAETDTCSTAKGVPCIAIPAGRVPVLLWEVTNGVEEIVSSTNLDIAAGEEWNFRATIINSSFTILRARLPVGATCADADRLPLPSTNAGVDARADTRSDGGVMPIPDSGVRDRPPADAFSPG
jgi:hypothetical protein